MILQPNAETLWRLFCIGKQAVQHGAFRGHRYAWIKRCQWPEFFSVCTMGHLTLNDVRDARDEALRLINDKLL